VAEEVEAIVVEDESDDEVEVKLEKANYPVGWDGNPIPFWLYKLHGLGIEFKCEICGNVSYWGPRAFDRHFQVDSFFHFVSFLV
jgi:splicing factor 3A subunit 3